MARCRGSRAGPVPVLCKVLFSYLSVFLRTMGKLSQESKGKAPIRSRVRRGSRPPVSCTLREDVQIRCSSMPNALFATCKDVSCALQTRHLCTVNTSVTYSEHVISRSCIHRLLGCSVSPVCRVEGTDCTDDTWLLVNSHIYD